HGYSLRGYSRKLAQADIWLPCHGLLVNWHYAAVIYRLGAPHVCDGDESVPWRGVYDNHAHNSGPVGGKNVQLARHAVAGQYPLYAGYAFCHWHGFILHIRRVNRYFPG